MHIPTFGADLSALTENGRSLGSLETAGGRPLAAVSAAVDDVARALTPPTMRSDWIAAEIKGCPGWRRGGSLCDTPRTLFRAVIQEPIGRFRGTWGSPDLSSAPRGSAQSIATMFRAAAFQQNTFLY